MNRRFWQRWLHQFPLSLRLSIPTTLLLLGIVVGVVNFRYGVTQAYRRVETDGYYQAQFSGSSTAGILNYFYRNNDVTGARLAMGQLSGNVNLRLSLLLDEQDQVIASTQYSLQSQPLAKTPAAAQQAEIARVRRSQSGLVMFSPDRYSVQAIYPVLLGINPGELRPSRIGILWLDYDLSQAKAQATQAAIRRVIVSNVGLLSAISMLWFLADQVLTRRANRLVAASHRLAKGELHIRTRLSGSDELAQISRAFDYMAEQIEVKTKALKANQAELEAAHSTATQKARELEQTLQELQRTQMQLIQTEKMSSLGQLVAGIAHEINNPVNFIYGNLVHIEEYIETLLELITAYHQHYPEPVHQLAEFIDENDIPFLVEDLPKIINSMRMGTDRIRQIVLSLRNFSRLDEAEMKTVDLHEGLDSTLLLLQNRLKGKGGQPQIEVVKHYGNLPWVECYPGQLNQVFMNLLSNAIEAITDSWEAVSAETEDTPAPPQPPRGKIVITTELVPPDWVRVSITDNGAGIPPDIQARLFDPFFTTKPIGQGTGLGLSISYQIITDRHQGKIGCDSEPGQGSTFWLEIPVQQTPATLLLD